MLSFSSLIVVLTYWWIWQKKMEFMHVLEQHKRIEYKQKSVWLDMKYHPLWWSSVELLTLEQALLHKSLCHDVLA